MVTQNRRDTKRYLQKLPMWQLGAVESLGQRYGYRPTESYQRLRLRLADNHNITSEHVFSESKGCLK